MQIDTIANIKFDQKLINYLAVLKPAATVILLSPKKTDLKDIIRFTVLELVLKKVICIEHKEILLHPSDPYKRMRTTVETDVNFASYRTHIYETYFLGIIDEKSYFQLRTYLERIYHEFPLDTKVKKSIIKEQKIRNLFSTVFTFDSFGIFRLNKNGQKIRNEIIRYLVTIERNLDQIIEDSPRQALELVSFLKGNFFLLRNVSTEKLEKLNKLIQQYKQERKDEYFNLFDIFEFSEIFFDEISEEIEALLKDIENAHNNRSGNSSYDDDILGF